MMFPLILKKMIGEKKSSQTDYADALKGNLI